jgi:hypothetical protein
MQVSVSRLRPYACPHMLFGKLFSFQCPFNLIMSRIFITCIELDYMVSGVKKCEESLSSKAHLTFRHGLDGTIINRYFSLQNLQCN